MFGSIVRWTFSLISFAQVLLYLPLALDVSTPAFFFLVFGAVADSCMRADCWQGGYARSVVVAVCLLRILRNAAPVSSHPLPLLARQAADNCSPLQNNTQHASAARHVSPDAAAADCDSRAASPDVERLLVRPALGLQGSPDAPPAELSVALPPPGARLVGEPAPDEFARVCAPRGTQHFALHPATRQAVDRERREEQGARCAPVGLLGCGCGGVCHLGLLSLRGECPFAAPRATGPS